VEGIRSCEEPGSDLINERRGCCQSRKSAIFDLADSCRCTLFFRPGLRRFKPRSKFVVQIANIPFLNEVSCSAVLIRIRCTGSEDSKLHILAPDTERTRIKDRPWPIKELNRTGSCKISEFGTSRPVRLQLLVIVLNK